jgi:hypothetical protein
MPFFGSRSLRVKVSHFRDTLSEPHPGGHLSGLFFCSSLITSTAPGTLPAGFPWPSRHISTLGPFVLGRSLCNAALLLIPEWLTFLGLETEMPPSQWVKWPPRSGPEGPLYLSVVHTPAPPNPIMVSLLTVGLFTFPYTVHSVDVPGLLLHSSQSSRGHIFCLFCSQLCISSLHTLSKLQWACV